jgi:hypothetical protein
MRKKEENRVDKGGLGLKRKRWMETAKANRRNGRERRERPDWTFCGSGAIPGRKSIGGKPP